jgi:hypothetical protein
LVLLTPEEHYTCHYKLVDMVEGEDKLKMLRAWGIMNDVHQIDGLTIMNAEKYGELRRDYINSISGENSSNSKEVYKIDKETGKILKKFVSAVEVEKKLGLFNISHCCRGSSMTVDGFIWCYAEDYSKELVQDRIDRLQSIKTTGVPVYRLDKNNGEILEEFESLAEAEAKTGVKMATLSHNLNGHNATAGKSLWCKIENYSEDKVK